MKISVVIPCYNAERYLAQAVGSALDQTRPPDEIVVVDDGSTDGSLDVALRLAARLPDRLQVISERSRSAARTRNIGAVVATGDTLLFLDADDVLGPDAVERLAEALVSASAGVAVCPWFRLTLREDRWMTGPPSCPPRRAGEDPLAAWLSGWYHPPCAVLWSRDGFDAAGRWDPCSTINDDGDLMMRALVHGVRLAETNRGSAYYRRAPATGTSLTSGRLSPEGLRNRLRTFEKIAWLLESRGRISELRPSIAAALSGLAAEARPVDAAIATKAAGLARRYRPSRLRRVAYHTRARLPGGAPAPDVRAVTPAVELRCGLDRAEALLAADPRVSSDARGPIRSMARPAISVIVPTYNRADLLARAVQSVLAQTFEDFELLVVDDGSTDDTPRAVESLRDPRLRYLRQSRNGGVAAARNRGLREARAELIAFLDSDDEWLPGKLAAQAARFGEVPDEVGLVYTGVVSVAADGRTRYKCSPARGDVYREMLAENVIHGGGSSVMLRRHVVASAGFFHEGLPAIEDYEYWLRVTRFFSVDVIDEPLIRYYDPPEGERRSLAMRANLEARGWVYRTYGAEMRRAGMAQWFLLKTARWALSGPCPDAGAARRLAVRAAMEAPTSRSTWQVVARTLLRSLGGPRWSRA